MGESAVSSGDGGGTEPGVQKAEEMEVIEGKNGETDSSVPAAALRWERFLPKMMLRVLLVEADDSTRQIIAALLKKCSYRVAAVSDGLKAWEVLKRRPHNVDLILTEVELPSISGYALLTLIMEHEICKNIPVIMMSSQDSVSMVYKCMLRGAADFLVKPVRKNELRNLWQHVWRRKAVSGIDNSNAPLSPQRNGDCIEKGSEDENSCVKLEMDTEEENKEHVEESVQRIWTNSLPTDLNAEKQEQHHDKDGDGNDDDPAHLKSSKQVIDLIGAFGDDSKHDYTSSGSKASADKIESSSSLLDLLTQYPGGSLNQFSDQRNVLNHSDASAFTRYINKSLQPGISMSPKICNQQEDYGTDADKHLSVQTLDYASQSSGPTMNFHTLMQQAHPFHLLDHKDANYEQSCRLVDQNTDIETIQAENKEGHQSEPRDDHGHFSAFTDQTANISACNGTTSAPLVISTAECEDEKVPISQDGNYKQSQREAALTKFRLKRKDRCFEKKVRYESRKKLAEQRPRVKGQFVRRLPLAEATKELVSDQNLS